MIVYIKKPARGSRQYLRKEKGERRWRKEERIVTKLNNDKIVKISLCVVIEI